MNSNSSSSSGSREFLIPSKDDVLCGRGRTCFEHEGNVSFRYIVASNITKYIEASRRKEKTRVARSIIQQVLDRGGKFLKKTGDGLWYDAGMKGAKEKVGHALRDASTDRVKCMTKMHQSLFLSNNQNNNDSQNFHIKKRSRRVSLDSEAFAALGKMGPGSENSGDAFENLVGRISPVEESESYFSDPQDDLTHIENDIRALSGGIQPLEVRAAPEQTAQPAAGYIDGSISTVSESSAEVDELFEEEDLWMENPFADTSVSLEILLKEAIDSDCSL